MSRQCIAQTPPAFGSPLSIKGLLESGITRAPEQEIVSANTTRLTYRKFAERVGRLASGLASLGVGPGDTVAIMDWDTNRYLECFFAVPMMGAVLHTVNVRLSAEQILYTINHAEDDVILINSEFLPLLEQIRERVETGKKLVLLDDTGKPPKSVQISLSFNAEYETLLAEAEDPKGSEKLWAGGWLHTGDVATIDTDGYVKITDRVKDMIRSGCEWISSLQIEEVILSHPGVAEAAVIAVPDPKWIERPPLALLVAKPCHETSEEQIKAHVRGFVEKGIITSYSVPDRIVFVEALPKTSVGKLDKKAMRERYAPKSITPQRFETPLC